MIREFSVKPKPSNNKARYAFIASMLVSFLLLMTSTLVSSYQGIVSLLGILFLVFALMIYTKYVSPVWFYDITYDTDGVPVFVVRQQIGKRHTTLCRIDLGSIVSVRKESAAERREHKTPQGVVKYTYMPSLDPAVSYRITTSSRYERAEILIESSEEFAGLLTAYAGEARSAREDNE
jgi:hypothetical protein